MFGSQWFVEFSKEPDDLDVFSKIIDTEMQKQNVYYQDLIQGNILRPLVLSKLKRDAFVGYMKSIGKSIGNLRKS